MKLVNFAALDPTHQRRGISGLKNSSRADAEIWEEFNANWNDLAAESEKALRVLRGVKVVPSPEESQESEESWELATTTKSETETEKVLKVRLGQAFFRSTVLSSYSNKCCVCQLPVKVLLVASHIVPWAKRVDLRVDPRNGLCLCTLHDRAFDRGLMTVDEKFEVRISPRLEEHLPHDVIENMFMSFHSSKIQLPEKFSPSKELLTYHRGEIFLSG